MSHLLHLQFILVWFKVVFGLRINLSKSVLVLVGEGPCLREFVEFFGCWTMQLPLTYLGLPLAAKFKSAAIWNLIIE